MSVPFDPARAVIAVPTRLVGPAGEHVASLALDTGATYTIISRQIADLLGFQPEEHGPPVPLTTGSGLEHLPPMVMHKVEALEQVRRHFRVLVHSLPPTASVDGLLGLDFLRGCRLVVDFREGLISLD